MEEELPQALGEDVKGSEPQLSPPQVADLIKENFPDLHLEEWVKDVLQKVHYKTLQKMVEFAQLRRALRKGGCLL